MANEIKNIKIEEIYPNPHNPRKEIRNITEMADSIRKKGIMQNLTVIKGHYEGEEYKSDGYMLLIGHRRHAGAKLAKLKEVPCNVIDEMPLNEQIAIMMLENCQRDELSIYEQSNGVQMLLDLGETEVSIAKKTGLSRTSVKHRANIAKLDQELLKKKENDDGFQLTLTALSELEKIEDIEERNKILDSAQNVRDLSWRCQNKVNEIKRDKVKEPLLKMIIAAGIEEAPKNAAYDLYGGKWTKVQEYSLEKSCPKKIELPEDEKLFYIVSGRDIKIIKKAPKKAQTPETIEKREQNKRKKQIKEILNEMDARRREFILSVVSGKIAQVKNKLEVEHMCWSALSKISTYASISNMCRLFTNKSEYDCCEEEKKMAKEKVEKLEPLFQMLATLHYAMASNVGELTTYDGQYNEIAGQKLLMAYDILERYGWSYEQGEKELLCGISELYTVKEVPQAVQEA